MTFEQCSECGALATSSSAEGTRCDLDISVDARTWGHQKLLTTNEPPEDTESTFIRAVASKTGSRLAYLDTKISQLRDWLIQLEEERATLTVYHSQNTAILSPLRRMPPELLCEIFSWTLPSVREALQRRRFDTKHSPWVLTQICSRWRAIALSTASLWSLVAVNCSKKAHRRLSSAYPLPMVQTQIQRAQKLKICFTGSSKRAFRPQVEIFQCLAEHSPRWEELLIGLTSELVPLLAALKNRLQSLRRLWIRWDGPQSRAGVESIDVFRVAPRLVDVTINEHRYMPVLLSGHRLTRYEMNGPWEMHRSILKLAQNLVDAHIEIADDEEPWPEQVDTITLSSLQRLYISHTEILAYLKAPALKEIAFYFEHGDPNPLIHVDSFVIRSDCTLGRLTLKGLPTAYTTVRILEKYPSITELATIILDDNFDGVQAQIDTLILNLTVPNPTGTAAISPQLSGIYFGCLGGRYIDSTLYSKMLQSRWKTKGCALKSGALLAESGLRPDPETLNRLDMLRQDGLDLSFLEGKEARVMYDWIYRRWD